MPFHRPKTRNPLPRRKHLAQSAAISYAGGRTGTGRNTEPVPLNNVPSPFFLYRHTPERFATLARDGRFQPYTGVPDGLHSLTWQRQAVTKEELQPRLFNILPVQSSYQHHTFTINQTCQIYIDRTQPPNGDRGVATCRKRCRPRTRCLSPTVRGTDLRTSPGARGRKGHRSHWGVTNMSQTNMSQTCLLQPTNLSTSRASVPRSSEPATTREQRSIQGPHWLGGALSTVEQRVANPNKLRQCNLRPGFVMEVSRYHRRESALVRVLNAIDVVKDWSNCLHSPN